MNDNTQNNEVAVIDLPRVAKNKQSKFTVNVDAIDFLSDVYRLGSTWAFTLEMNNNLKLICNVPDTADKQRFEELRQKVRNLMGASVLDGFEEFYPSEK